MLNRFTAFMAMIALVLSTLVTPNLAYADGNSVLAGKWMSATEAEMDEARGGSGWFAVYKVGSRVYYKFCKTGETFTACMKRTGVRVYTYVTRIADFISVADGIAKVRSYICRTYGKMC